MASTSPDLIAERLLAACLRGEGYSLEDVFALLDSPALFGVVAEGLNDRFEPRLCSVYAELFAQAIAMVRPEVRPSALLARYRRARVPRMVRQEPSRVYVLSRVTLGADISVTSVLLDAAKQRFPHAEIYLAGARKNWELFAADPRVLHLPVTYHKGGLRERLAHWRELGEALNRPDAIVLDPDSRLTQLGLLPVCASENYFFFESRGYGGEGGEPLPALAARWAMETLGIEVARPYIAPELAEFPAEHPLVTVSLGVGENSAKRLAGSFERSLLEGLVERGARLVVDKGAGGDEAARVEFAAAGLPVHLWEGSFAGFASLIARSRLYIGYDSAGQHAAAAAGVPLVTVFAGYPCLRMFDRWRPSGAGPVHVIRVAQPDPDAVLTELWSYVDDYLPHRK